MSFEPLFALVYAAAEFLGIVAAGGTWLTKAELAALRAQAMQQWHALQARLIADPSGVQGRTAQVLHQQESQQGGIYVLTIFAVTPDNRYLMFKCTPPHAPFWKLLTPVNAKVVLKHQFRSYEPDAP